MRLLSLTDQPGAATCPTSNAPRPDYRLLSLDANGAHCQSPRPALTKSVRAYFISTNRRVCASNLSAAQTHHCGRAKDKRHCRKPAYSANRLGSENLHTSGTCEAKRNTAPRPYRHSCKPDRDVRRDDTIGVAPISATPHSPSTPLPRCRQSRRSRHCLTYRR
jgi:hypothetical protein